MRCVERRRTGVICTGILLLFFLYTAGYIYPVKAYAAGREDTAGGFDVVLVFDTSDTMRETDPVYAARNAAAMFVDSLYMGGGEEETAHMVFPESAVGIVKYGDSAQIVRQLSQVQSEEALDYVRRDIYDKVYCSAGEGDGGLGEALREAARMLKDVADHREKRVLLFTDGYTGGAEQPPDSADLDPLMPFFGGDGQSALEEAMILAREAGCVICVAGLDWDGSIPDSDWEQFRRVANCTQIGLEPERQSSRDDSAAGGGGRRWTCVKGIFPREHDGMREIAASWDDGQFVMENRANLDSANYLRARSRVEIQEFYVDVTAAMAGTRPDVLIPYPEKAGAKDVNIYEKEFDASGGAAAVFNILSENRLESVGLESPSETFNFVQHKSGWLPGGKVRIQWWQGYTTVTVLEPEAGTWRLSVRGTLETVRCVVLGGNRDVGKGKKAGELWEITWHEWLHDFHEVNPMGRVMVILLLVIAPIILLVGIPLAIHYRRTGKSGPNTFLFYCACDNPETRRKLPEISGYVKIRESLTAYKLLKSVIDTNRGNSDISSYEETAEILRDKLDSVKILNPPESKYPPFSGGEDDRYRLIIRRPEKSR